MRLIDLLQPYLAGVHTVVDATTGELDLEPFLHLPPEVGYRREATPEEVAAGSLALVTIGPDVSRHGEVGHCREIIGRLRVGGRAVVLFGHPVDELPYHLVLDDLVANHCQIMQAATLDYNYLTCGIATACVERLRVPRDYCGREHVYGHDSEHAHAVLPATAGEDTDGADGADGADSADSADGAAGLETQLRIAGEYVLTDFVSRRLRSRLMDMAGGALAPSAVELGQHAEDLEHQRDQLQQELRASEARLRRVQGRLTALESSTTLALGQALIGATRRPKRAAVRLPRQLYLLWRGRGQGAVEQPPSPRAGGAGGAGDAGSVLAEPNEQERLLVSYSSVRVEARTQLVVVGVVTDQTRAAFAPHATVNAVLPHDALLVLERVSPDVLLVEAAACQPGGPWAHTGTSAAADRDRRLADMVVAARAQGCPVVLWRNAPAHAAPWLDRIDWDEVVTGGTGVPLDVFNPIGLDSRRSREPVFVGPRDPRAPLGAQRSLDEVLRGTDPHIVEPVSWRRLPELYREHALFVTGDPEHALRQLACGAHLISPAREDLQRLMGPYASFAADAEQAAKHARVLAGAGPRSREELRGLLRDIFTHHTVPVRLAALVRRLGLGADPLASRKLAVLARVDGGGQAARFVDGVMSQRHRPDEVVVHGTGVGERALDELAGSGIMVRRVSRAGWPDMAAAASVPWVFPWHLADGYPPNHLLDLVCAGECSRADIVGPPEPDTGREPGHEPDYVFTSRVTPALVRRELLTSAAGPTSTAGTGSDGSEGLDDSSNPGSAGHAGSNAGGLAVAAWVRRGARAFALAPHTGTR